MPYIQRITPPPNKVLTFSLKNFGGGLNNRSDQLKDNEASDLLNMEFTDDTLVEKRKGQAFFDAVDVGSSLVFIDEFQPHRDASVLIRASQNFMYIESNILTNLSGKPRGVNHNGRYFFADGSKLYVYGLFQQSNNTHRRVVGVPINDYVLFEIVSPPDGHARLDASHVEGVLVADYTNFVVYYEPCQNEFVDTFSGANKVPANINYIVSHNGRVYLSGSREDDDNVFISDIRNPFYYPVSLPIQLPPNSDKIVGMIVYDNAVIVGRHEDIYAIFGNTNRPDMGVDVFNLRRINTHTGFANSDTVVIAHNHLFFFGNDGNAYSMSSARLNEKQMSTTIISKQIDIEKKPINLTLRDVRNSSSVFHKDMWYVSIKDVILIYSYRNMSWMMWSGLDATSMYVYNDNLIWGRSDGRTAGFSNDVYLDFNEPYQAYWHSRYFDMNDANSFKQFREFFIVAHTFNDHNSDINILFEIDYADVKDRVIVENQISIWGKSKWGDRWVSRNINASIPFVIGRRGRNIRFKFSNGYFVHGSVPTHSQLEYYQGRNEGILVRVVDEGRFYLYTRGGWVLMQNDDLNQRMKIYQVNGDYEFRGKR